jgi:hypothetical protein
MASKNSRTGKQRNFMGHHEGDMLNTLPRYNYATGKGWRSHNKGRGVMERCAVVRKEGGRRHQRGTV